MGADAIVFVDLKDEGVKAETLPVSSGTQRKHYIVGGG